VAAAAETKITAVTQRQQSTKCDSISNINGDDNGNKDKSSDDDDNDDGDSDNGNDDEYDDDNDNDDGNGNDNGNGDGDGDGDSGNDDNNNNDDDCGGSRWATAAADGVVWGRRQAAKAAEMGIKRKWEECGYDRQNFLYRYRTIVMWVTFYMYPTAFHGY
jgi:hypothetical protein